MKKRWHLISIVNVFIYISIISCSDNNSSIVSNKELHQSLQGNNYYLLSMDNISKSKINDKIIQDYRPNNNTRKALIWSDSYSKNLCTDNNFYNEFQGWPSFTVGTNGWSAVAFNSSVGANGFDFTKLDESYTFHMAIKGTSPATHAVRFLGSDGKLYGFAIGNEALEGVTPYIDFERDGEWHEIEVPMKELFDKGLKYNSIISSGDMVIFYSGGVSGTTLDIDALFFYQKK